MKNLYQKEVKLFKTRLVEDKRDIIKRIITSLAENKASKPDNVQKFVGDGYAAWRETLYKKMTHFSTKNEEIPQERTEDNPNLPHTQNKEGSSSSGSDKSSKSQKS